MNKKLEKYNNIQVYHYNIYDNKNNLLFSDFESFTELKDDKDKVYVFLYEENICEKSNDKVLSLKK